MVFEVELKVTLFLHVSGWKTNIWASISFITVLMDAWHSIFNALCTLTLNFSLDAIKPRSIEHYICGGEITLSWLRRRGIYIKFEILCNASKMKSFNFYWNAIFKLLLKAVLPPTFSDAIYCAFDTCLHYGGFSIVRCLAKNQSAIQMPLLLICSLLVEFLYSIIIKVYQMERWTVPVWCKQWNLCYTCMIMCV